MGIPRVFVFNTEYPLATLILESTLTYSIFPVRPPPPWRWAPLSPRPSRWCRLCRPCWAPGSWWWLLLWRSSLSGDICRASSAYASRDRRGPCRIPGTFFESPDAPSWCEVLTRIWWRTPCRSAGKDWRPLWSRGEWFWRVGPNDPSWKRPCRIPRIWQVCGFGGWSGPVRYADSTCSSWPEFSSSADTRRPRPVGLPDVTVQVREHVGAKRALLRDRVHGLRRRRPSDRRFLPPWRGILYNPGDFLQKREKIEWKPAWLWLDERATKEVSQHATPSNGPSRGSDRPSRRVQSWGRGLSWRKPCFSHASPF